MATPCFSDALALACCLQEWRKTETEKKGRNATKGENQRPQNKTKMINALFANSLQIPVSQNPPPHNLPVPFCRGNLPALDENDIKKTSTDGWKIYIEQSVDI